MVKEESSERSREGERKTKETDVSTSTSNIATRVIEPFIPWRGRFGEREMNC